MSIHEHLEAIRVQKAHGYVLAYIKAINGLIGAAGDLGVCTGQQPALAVQWDILAAAIKALEQAVELASGHPDLEIGWKDVLDGLAKDLDAFVDALPALEAQVQEPAADTGTRTR